MEVVGGSWGFTIYSLSVNHCYFFSSQLTAAADIHHSLSITYLTLSQHLNLHYIYVLHLYITSLYHISIINYYISALISILNLCITSLYYISALHLYITSLYYISTVSWSVISGIDVIDSEYSAVTWSNLVACKKSRDLVIVTNTSRLLVLLFF